MLNRILNDGIYYGALSGLSKILIFLVLPFLTRALSPNEYGQIEILLVFGVLLSVISIAGTDSAFSFYFFKEDSSLKNGPISVLFSTLAWRIISSFVLILVVSLFKNNLLELFSLDITSNHAFSLVLAILLAQHLTSLGMDYNRFSFNRTVFAIIVVAQSSSASILMFVFVILYNLGVDGYFWALLLSHLIGGSAFLIQLLKQTIATRALKISILPLLKFGIPLVPAGFAVYGMNTLDRWFILRFTDAHELGKFAIAAKLAIVVTILVEAFRTAWWPIVMQYLRDEKRKNDEIKRVSKFYLVYSSLFIFVVSFFSYPVLYIFGGVEFMGYHSLIGVLGLISIIYGYAMIGTLGIWVSEKTYLLAISSFIALVLGVALNIVFVPKLGVYGASFGTLITYMIWMWLGIRLSERETSFEINPNFVIAVLALSCFLSFVFSHLGFLLFVKVLY